MKYKDLIGIFPDSTTVTLFVDYMYYATCELTDQQFEQFKNANIMRMQSISLDTLIIEISTLDLEA